ncbi:hypothetical protein [Pleionea sediminis]|uniref:hypothetical protein n=1 Tax=Pleionea sediminis TaxID=2569479 RepID=UPI0011856CDF|nr:hypothetical protein [Pleionea sediminis]
MIFAIERINEHVSQIQRFDNLDEVSNSLEWQDVYGGAYTVLSDEGEVYGLNATEENEPAVVYGYTFTTKGTNTVLSRKCVNVFAKQNWPEEIEVVNF